MEINALIAAFGGGLVGALIGGLPAFVMTGLIVIAGTVASLANPAAGALIGNIAFGSFFGPHIAFAGGAAATAYAARRGYIKEGASLDSVYGTGAPDALLVGGLFGIIGYLINFLWTGVLHFNTDTVALTVFFSGLIARLVFGKTGITGKFKGEGKRVWFSMGKGLLQNLAVGLGLGVIAGFTPSALAAAGVPQEWITGNFATLCFGIAAFSLIFAAMGKASPGFHHIILPAALAAVASGSPIFGIL
ncbi:MAG: hypothetical protein RRY38_02080, partial [Oscillospiraceae bacterium]